MPEPISYSQFSDLLKSDGPVAIVLKQLLAPVNEDDPIFPPSYPMITFKGRVHTIQDGDYRVSVELPANPKTEKTEKKSVEAPGYNIDRFPDGTNTCEIDSPQSQANRIEPEFKKQHLRPLIPQIEIRIGNDPIHGATVNLLDAGHRAGDAVVRMSSLADKFHMAFLDAKNGNHFTLATLAPTSLLFGVWDSRSTQVKLQRIVKASIRASNVRECTRSAQFTPAAAYVVAGAVSEELGNIEGDQNPLSSEGMLHALAVQKIGGVMLTPAGDLTRTLNVNLVAIRALRGNVDAQTEALQRYILGLSLLAATIDPDLNLREGCNLRFKNAVDIFSLVPRRGDAKSVTLDLSQIAEFATASANQFFACAEIPFDQKDHLDATFESGVAEEFLGLIKKDRDKVRQLGPVTSATLKRFHDQRNDPFKSVSELLKTAKAGLSAKKGETPVNDPEIIKPLHDALTQMSGDSTLADNVRALALRLAAVVNEPNDAKAALTKVEGELKKFKKSQKDAAKSGTDDAESKQGE